MSHIKKHIINWIFFCYLFVHVFLQDFASTTIYIVVQYIFDVVISIYLICRYPFYGIYLLPFFVLSITYFMVQMFQQENVHVFVKLLPPILLAYQGYKKNINPLVPLAFFCLLSVVYLYLYFIVNLDPQDFGNSSRNSIGYNLIMVSTIYYIVHYVRGTFKDASILISITGFALSIVAFGRSGIFLSGLLMLTVVYQKAIQFKSISWKLMVIVIIPIYFFAIDFGVIELIEDRFSGSSDDVRFTLIKEFIENYSIVNTITGYNFSSSKLISQYDNNPHNSYIEIVARHGVGGVFIIIMILNSLIRILLKRNYLLFFLFFPFLGRIFFDIGGLYGPGMIVVVLLYMAANLNVKSY